MRAGMAEEGDVYNKSCWSMSSLPTEIRGLDQSARQEILIYHAMAQMIALCFDGSSMFTESLRRKKVELKPGSQQYDSADVALTPLG